jgi:hypothetical protein
MPRQILQVAAFLICAAVASHAGGPAFVAGSGYNQGVEGQPLIWANGSVEYFTNPGALSPILTEAQADALVASAFSTWTSIPGVALTATQGGHLAEYVDGADIETNGFGVVTAPADITPSATGTPVGIVYDYDGTVTDAILGAGAGDLADCFTNAVYGGPEFFTGREHCALAGSNQRSLRRHQRAVARRSIPFDPRTGAHGWLRMVASQFERYNERPASHPSRLCGLSGNAL